MTADRHAAMSAQKRGGMPTTPFSKRLPPPTDFPASPLPIFSVMLRAQPFYRFASVPPLIRQRYDTVRRQFNGLFYINSCCRVDPQNQRPR